MYPLHTDIIAYRNINNKSALLIYTFQRTIGTLYEYTYSLNNNYLFNIYYQEACTSYAYQLSSKLTAAFSVVSINLCLFTPKYNDFIITVFNYFFDDYNYLLTNFEIFSRLYTIV